jgi:glycosyltransferase involved in cell wall biosynthesis
VFCPNPANQRVAVFGIRAVTSLDTIPVSIGIPTFNRVDTLERALTSALNQTHTTLDVVVSDNASRDGTEALCHAIAARDPRVRYIRRRTNIGPTANFNVLFKALTAPYAMVLADDDWLDPEYVERCLHALRQQPGCVAVSGRGRYWRGDTPLARQGLDLQLGQRDGRERVHAYCRVIGGGRGEDSTFFGVISADALQRATPMPNALGGDMLVTARLAFQGTVQTLADVCINRSVGGSSVSMRSIVETLELARLQAWVPSLTIAQQLLADLGWREPIYAELPRISRLSWGLRCACSAISWPSLVWHLSAPPALALGRRPRGRLLWRALAWSARVYRAKT